MIRKHWKTFAIAILITEAVGGLSGWLTKEGARQYAESVAQPPLSPPPFVFPIAWGLLFALMGISAARIWLAPASPQRTDALRIFALQLAFNFFWSLIFFNFQAYGFALVWLAVLWLMIAWMIVRFYAVSAKAAALQIPYFLWVTFAAYLNFGVWRLN